MLNADRWKELTEIRAALGLTQPAMAYLLELPTREYQAFEWRECEIPNLYILAAERIAMAHAVVHNAPMKAPPAVREEAFALARLVEATKPVREAV